MELCSNGFCLGDDEGRRDKYEPMKISDYFITSAFFVAVFKKIIKHSALFSGLAVLDLFIAVF
jgi:hypothetical protein